MNIAIIVSITDPAGMNIKQNLLELFEFKKLDQRFEEDFVYEIKLKNKLIKLYTVSKESIFNEHIDKKINADLFIFATTHRSKAGIPSLSVHSPGNWSKAELGGEDNKLCIAPASYLKLAFIELNELGKDLDFEIVNEVVHHGPYLEKPVFFIEIGSSEKQWSIKEAGAAIAKTIINVLSKEIPKFKIAIAIGGLHTCSNFNKIVLNTDIALGQICPKYMLEFLDKEMLEQAIEKTQEKVDFILLDWKGLGQYKEKIKKLVEEINLPVKKTKEIEK